MSNWNLNEVSTSQKTEKKEYKKVDYLKTPGSYTCTVNGQLSEKEMEGYTGSPFLDFIMYTSDGKKTKARFWTPKETDAPKTADFKRKLLKEFMINCGVKDFTNMSDALDQVIGKRLQVCFTTQEYIGTDRETNEPVVRTSLQYKFSKKVGETIKYDAKYNRTLSPEQTMQYNELHKLWSETKTTVEDDDNLPF
jgi:hypothetical protein